MIKASGAETAPTSSKDEEEEPVYAIGRLKVKLAINKNPGLDLTEAGGLVLVSALSQETAAQTGIQLLDTIVEVSTTDNIFQKSTKALNLDETGGALEAASIHALQNGMTEIELELNRLIKGYFS
eukprot:CAMPEP_0183308854 /NCGR_PEP_ID=MMETSP0160_2-20130417/22659_1 /TAXON_ID=2839 ORGANISM="Odontella Sinensis, Strain Grunow 1884" /NCGR_SAMPLE_ID=MMETSP0160_2 /ASSEMBLY_ACC=CAM_ASM_000250 /LENGTH=124 /DNA_ID=CAMNT_0025472759 /DNA_START=254 /DNA_END=628 /DNA_ORIENTATION=+